MIDKIKNFKNLSPVAKASLALLFANLVLKGLSMISGPIFTRLMPADQYGIVSTFTSWQTMLTALITLNLGSGVFNNGMLEFKDDRSSFQFSLIIVSCSSALLFLVVFQVFKQQLLEIFEMPEQLAYLLFLYYFFVPIFGYWSGRQRFEYKYKLLTLLTILIAVVSLGLGVISVVSVPDDNKAMARIIATDLPKIVVGFIFLIYIGVQAKFRAKIKYMVYAVKFNLPLLPHYLSMYVLSSSDRIMITKIVGAAYTAIYSVSYTVGMIINIVWTSVESAIAPWIYEKLNVKDYKSVRSRTFQILVFFAVLSNFCALFAPEIIWILAPKQYYEGVYIIPSIAASSFFIAAYSMHMRVELFYKQTVFATACTCIAAVTNIILNYIFIPMFGYIAAGYTTLVCYTLLFALHSINVHMRGFSNAIDSKKIWLLAVIVLITSCFMNVVYRYTVLRVGLILIILSILIIKRDAIVKLFKKK